MKDTAAGIIPGEPWNSNAALLHKRFLLKAWNQTKQLKNEASEQKLFEGTIRSSYFISQNASAVTLS